LFYFFLVFSLCSFVSFVVKALCNFSSGSLYCLITTDILIRKDLHMADISAVFGIFLLLGVAFPGMLSALWLLFPATVERARLRLERTPWQCFWLGGVITALVIIPVVVLLALPFGAAKFVGWTIVTIVLALSNIGAAGLAAKMGEQLANRSGNGSPIGAFVRGAVALELAMIFPVFGWAFVLPLAIVSSIGATGFALLHWVPKKAALLSSETVPAQS
jgi:hypothetical protein